MRSGSLTEPFRTNSRIRQNRTGPLARGFGLQLVDALGSPAQELVALRVLNCEDHSFSMDHQRL
jgi:hypothetical protein